MVRSAGGLATEADAYAFLERIRWGTDGPTECPHCGSDKGAWYLKPKNPEGRKSKGGSSARSQRRVWKCRENSCRRQFSVLTNTVLHATQMPVRAWVGAVVDLCEDPAGVSARDIAARWDVTEKSAWAMLNRIQDALGQPEIAGASLRSNAPLWFELPARATASIDQQRRQADQVAARLEAGKVHADRVATEQIERDVQQVLADLQEVKPTPKNARVEQSSDPIGTADGRQKRTPKRRLASVGESEPQPVATGSADSDGTPTDAKIAHGSTSQPRAAEVEQQVQRVLAEVFGAAEEAPSVPADAPVKDGSLGGPQPVDNSAESHPDRPAPDAKPPSRAQARRAKIRRQRAAQSGPKPPRDELGSGWLDAPASRPSEDGHEVSRQQGKLRGMDTFGPSELGPAWSDPAVEVSSNAPHNDSASADQIALFVDGSDEVAEP